jgi:hypothetical protein
MRPRVLAISGRSGWSYLTDFDSAVNSTGVLNTMRRIFATHSTWCVSLSVRAPVGATFRARCPRNVVINCAALTCVLAQIRVAIGVAKTDRTLKALRRYSGPASSEVMSTIQEIKPVR